MKSAAKPTHCPACQSEYSRVIDARAEPPTIREQLTWGGGYWRRRVCETCRRTFTTEESVTALDPIEDSPNI